MFIACPACKSKFKAKPALLGKTIPCPKCKEPFEAVARREKVRSEGFNPVVVLLILGAILALAIIVIVADDDDPELPPLAKKEDDEPPPRPFPAATTPDEDLLAHVGKIVAAMREEGNADLPRWIAFDAAYARTPAAADRAWGMLTDLDKYAFKEGFVEALTGVGAERDFNKVVVAKDLAIGARDASTVEIAGRLENPLLEQFRTAKFTLRAPEVGKLWQLVGYEPGPIETKGGKSVGMEETVTAAGDAPLQPFRGVALPDPFPVDPLPETSSVMTSAIESAMKDLRDPSATTAASRARLALAEAGQHAVPYLLNALAAVDLADPQQMIVGVRISNALTDVTGIEYPIVPGDNAGSMIGEGAAENDTNRRRWFAWWRDHGAAFAKFGKPEPKDEPEEDDDG
jgi:hypothetical protein